jgi:putative ABC transport system permease protein
MVGVAAVIAIVGLTQSAEGAVSVAFDAELATEVSFQEVGVTGSTPLLTEQSEPSIRRLRGVEHAGLISPLDGGQPLPVTRTPAAIPGGADSVELPFTVATPGALATMHAVVSSGRLYDGGFEARHEMVALIGAPAAAQLAMTRTEDGPAIFVNSVPLTVIGVVSHVSQQNQALLGVIIPPDVAPAVSATVGPPSMIVETAPGAAQVVGEEGPYALAPENPRAIVAQVPPDPRTLREQVEGSVAGLLLVLALVSFALGIVAIGNTTLLSVLQRRSEIGLRRSLGATPRHIAVLVVGEAGFVGTIGGMVGASIGILVTSLVDVARGWSPVLSWQVSALSPAFGALAGIIAGVYPAFRATRIAPVAALQGQ